MLGDQALIVLGTAKGLHKVIQNDMRGTHSHTRTHTYTLEPASLSLTRVIGPLYDK